MILRENDESTLLHQVEKSINMRDRDLSRYFLNIICLVHRNYRDI